MDKILGGVIEGKDVEDDAGVVAIVMGVFMTCADDVG